MAKCISPLTRKVDWFSGRHYIQIPCGNCINCQKNKRLLWQFRLEQEYISCKFSRFLTFTYAEEHLPTKVCNDGSVHGCLSKDVLQRLIKRFRERCKRLYDSEFRHYSCGEYGETDGLSHRPHYHIILFTNSSKIIDNLEDILQEVWPYGRVDITTVGGGTFGYMTQDMMKSFDPSLDKNFVENEFVRDWCDRLGLTQPFKLMSTRPFIGYAYVEKARLYHKSSIMQNCVVSLISGVKLPLPEIYRLKYWPRNKFFNEAIYFKKQKMRQLSEIELSIQDKFASYSIPIDQRCADRLIWCQIESSDPERQTSAYFRERRICKNTDKNKSKL